jgi:hypothetical protein
MAGCHHARDLSTTAFTDLRWGPSVHVLHNSQHNPNVILPTDHASVLPTSEDQE